MKTLNMFYLVIYWTQKVHNDFILLCSLHCAAISFTVARRFSFTMSSTAATPSGVITGCVWPGRGESVTELMPFMNFLVHSYTCCSDRHASPYWTFIVRWISMGFTPSVLKKTDDRTLSFFGACCKRGRHLYTTTAPSCCIPASYCHLSATLQTMSITVVNLQDNRYLFRIFIALLSFSFDSPSYDAAGTWHHSQWGYSVLFLYLLNSITAHSPDYFCTFSHYLDTEVGSGDTLTYCLLINYLHCAQCSSKVNGLSTLYSKTKESVTLIYQSGAIWLCLTYYVLYVQLFLRPHRVPHRELVCHINI